jgi:hypothetical protein
MPISSKAVVSRGASSASGTHRIQAPTRGQLLARERFELQIGRLRRETSLGRPRDNLAALVRVCEGLLDEAGTGAIVTHYRNELGRARAAVAFTAPR